MVTPCQVLRYDVYVPVATEYFIGKFEQHIYIKLKLVQFDFIKSSQQSIQTGGV